MSLIFSALSEMEKQAQEGQPVREPMSGMQPLSPERKQWPILIGALGVLGLGAFVAVKLLSPTAVEISLVQPAAAISSQPADSFADPTINTLSNTALTPATPTLAPYMQTTPAEIVTISTTENLMPISSSSASMTTAVPVYASTQPIAAPAEIAAAAVIPSSGAIATVAASQNEVAVIAVETTPEQQAAPVPRTPPDKSYLDKTTFKLGRQADSSKDQDVSHWVNLFSSEMSSGNYDQAYSHLSKLQSKLPAQSITLLRMQAWYAVDTSDDNAARGLFLRILDRVPEDQNAGVNVALIDWRAKNFSAALARIDRLHQKYPDSSLVSQNWRSMHDQRQ